MIELVWGVLGVVLVWLVKGTAFIITTRNKVDAMEKVMDDHKGQHGDHYKHAKTTDIHQRTYSAELIDSKIDNVKQEIKALGDRMDDRFDTLTESIRELAREVNSRRLQ